MKPALALGLASLLALAPPLATAAGTTARTSVAAAGKTAPQVHQIVIQAVAYQPPTLVVRRGDTVVWVNKDPFPHNVTSTQGFRSPDIAPGASWRFVARRRGDYQYGCTLHATMQAVLRVE